MHAFFDLTNNHAMVIRCNPAAACEAKKASGAATDTFVQPQGAMCLGARRRLMVLVDRERLPRSEGRQSNRAGLRLADRASHRLTLQRRSISWLRLPATIPATASDRPRAAKTRLSC